MNGEWDELEKRRQRRIDSIRRYEEKRGNYESKELGAVLKITLKKSGLNFMKKNRGVLQAWNETVGEEIGMRTYPASFRAGVLTVDVDNAGLLQELAQFHHDALLESLRAACPATTIRKISFKLGVEKK